MTETRAGQRGSAMRNIGQRPLAAQAREILIESIMANEFEDGRIPPEKELAARLGVSRTTVRAALQSLQDAGVIVRTRGRGTTLRRHATPSMLALHRLVGFGSMLRETGREPSVEVEWTRTEAAPPDVVALLGEQPEGDWYCMDKLFRADGLAAIAIRHYVPVSYFAADFEAGPADADWFEISERFGGERIDHAVVEIRAECADDDTAQRLEVGAGMPLIVLHETHYSEREQPLAYSRIAVNQQYVTFQVLRSA